MGGCCLALVLITLLFACELLHLSIDVVLALHLILARRLISFNCFLVKLRIVRRRGEVVVPLTEVVEHDAVFEKHRRHILMLCLKL